MGGPREEPPRRLHPQYRECKRTIAERRLSLWTSALPQAFRLRLQVRARVGPFTDSDSNRNRGRRESRVRHTEEPRRNCIDLTHHATPDADPYRCNERPPATYS